MEYALRGDKILIISKRGEVLILILMEYALRDDRTGILNAVKRDVLILILMEYALRGQENI